MKTTELIEKLKKIEDLAPIIYQNYKEIKSTPFIVLVEDGADNTPADNHVYFSNTTHTLELYTEYKNFELEEKLEKLLNENEIYWTKSADIRIEDQDLTVIYYELS